MQLWISTFKDATCSRFNSSLQTRISPPSTLCISSISTASMVAVWSRLVPTLESRLFHPFSSWYDFAKPQPLRQYGRLIFTLNPPISPPFSSCNNAQSQPSRLYYGAGSSLPLSFGFLLPWHHETILQNLDLRGHGMEHAHVYLQASNYSPPPLFIMQVSNLNLQGCNMEPLIMLTLEAQMSPSFHHGTLES